MGALTRARQGGELLLGLVVVSLLVGQALGQPILLGYVTTGSMKPTLDPGDGFVAIPASLAGDIDEGDVVTFRAEELQGGGLTTHRVVGRTDAGYITKGDANPFTDQDGSEPPVKRPQIVAVALQVNGQVVVVPELGTVVTGVQSVLSEAQRRIAVLTGSRALLGTQGLALLLFAASMSVYAFDVLFGQSERKDRTRDTKRDDGLSAHTIVAALALVVVLTATAAMVVPSGPHQFGVVSSESDSPGARVIATGTSESLELAVPNGAFLPTHVFLEPASDGVSVSPRRLTVPGRSQATATVTLSAPPQTGYYRRFVVEHRYLAVLPRSTVAALYAVHPLLPVAVIDALLGGSFTLLGLRLVGSERVKLRKHDGPSGGILPK